MLLKTLSDESDEVQYHFFPLVYILSSSFSLEKKHFVKPFNPSIPQVILKDLEVLAEIASSPAGQTYNSGMCDSADSKTELQVPEHSSMDHQLVVGEALMLLSTPFLLQFAVGSFRLHNNSIMHCHFT